MNYLLNFCILLWIVPYLGKQFYSEFFNVWYIQWVSFGLLIVLLPYGFTKSILSEKSYKLSYSFLFIFLLQLYTLCFGLNSLNKVNTILSINLNISSLPENSSLDAIHHEDPDVREFMAKAIYTQFGQPIMYKNISDDLVLYYPTDRDKSDFKERLYSITKAETTTNYIYQQLTQITYLFGLACGCFFIVFTFTHIFNKSKANKVK